MFCQTVNKHLNESNVVIGALAPSYNGGQKRIATLLLCNMLGGPASNSLLNASLREKNGWAYAVECVYTQYSDCGIVAITLGCDKSNLKKCLAQIDAILEKVSTEEFSEAELSAAKKQLLGQLAIASDSGEAQCLSMGKSLLCFGRISADAENARLIQSVTAAEVLQAAQEVFADRSTLIYK